MTKKPQVKCPYCEERDERDSMVRVKNRYWHQECIVAQREENTNGVQTPPNLEGSTPEQEYKELIAYICEKYDMSRPSGQILKQIKTFADEYGYRYKGMELALRYFFDTEENSVKNDTGVGIIPYVYDRAKNFHLKKIEIAKSLPKEEAEVRAFKVRQRNNKRNRNMIEIDDL